MMERFALIPVKDKAETLQNNKSRKKLREN